MTQRERQILNWIEADPMISQQELAERAGITRSSVAVHISNLMKKGCIAGKGYIVTRSPYVTVVCTLEDVCRAAGWLLRWGGRFCVVFPTERLAELLEMARRFGLEPKRLRLVQHDAVGAPGLVLLECRRGGKPGLRAEPTLLLYGPDGRETAEHRRAYFREEEQAL